MAKFDETKGRWITTKGGKHIFIKEGNSGWLEKSGSYERDTDERDVAPYKDLLNGTTTAKEVPMHRHDLISQYGEDLKDYLKEHHNQLPDKIEFGESNTQKDAFLSALNKNYDLNAEESKYLNKIKRDYVNGKPVLKLGDDESVSIMGLTDDGVNGLKKMLCAQATKKDNDPVSKQEKDIAKRAEQTKALNDEKKANDLADENKARQQKLVDTYRKELKDYLKKNDGKLPRQINMGTTTAQRDAVLSALNAEYELSPAEDKIWGKIQFQNRDGVPHIWLPGKAPISTLGLSQNAISGLRKWLCVWGAKNL